MQSRTSAGLGVAIAALVVAAVWGTRISDWRSATPAATAGVAEAPETLVPVNLLITAEPRHGAPLPVLTPDDVLVNSGKNPLHVDGFELLAGTPLELAVLIDDSCDATLALHYVELRKFMARQPPATAIGVGYIREGMVEMATGFTTDRDATARALRLPVQQFGISASPYVAISGLVRHWPGAGNARREILVMTDGVDLLWGDDPFSDPYLQAAVDDAQRAGTPVFAIYADAAGHAGHSYFRIWNGQNEIAELTEYTGAESYFLGDRTALDFTPFLDDLSAKLNAQYEITMSLPAGRKGGFVGVRVRTPLANVSLLSQNRVWVPAAPQP